MKSDLDVTFAALSDPTRRAILQRLIDGEASVADLAAPFELSPRAVAKHVAVLEAAGLVTRRREAQRNMAALRPDAFRDISKWLQIYADIWGERFTRLGAHLARPRPR
jgi:DNA-binding transcriptional ArsR family regulator